MYVTRLLLLSLLLAGSGISLSAQAEIEDIISSFVNVALGQQPNNEFGTAIQYKARALNITSNIEIYGSTPQEIIERSGFKQVTYQVESEDGYITNLINIINPLAEKRVVKMPPVILFHPGLTNPSCWIFADAIEHHPEKYPRTPEEDGGAFTSSNRSLAFMLANNGYDVWLAGTRGSSKQNMGHTQYKVKLFDQVFEDLFSDQVPTGREFIDTLRYFDYSLDELVDYEYPKQIEAVLQVTGSNKVSIVTYALATPVMFSILSSNKALSRRVHCFVALSPMLNSNGANKLIEALNHIIPKTPIPLGTLLLELVLSKPVRDIARNLKRYEVFKPLINLLFGPSAKYLTDLEDAVIGNTFSPTSFKEILHAVQIIKVGQLQRFDYGPDKNLQLHGGFEPPAYNVSLFKTKHWMVVSGANDVLATPSSADQYVNLIPVKPYKHLTIDGYNHLDMILAFNNDEKVNLPVLEFFERFLNEVKQRNDEPTE